MFVSRVWQRDWNLDALEIVRRGDHRETSGRPQPVPDQNVQSTRMDDIEYLLFLLYLPTKGSHRHVATLYIQMCGLIQISKKNTL